MNINNINRPSTNMETDLKKNKLTVSISVRLHLKYQNQLSGFDNCVDIRVSLVPLG